MTVGTSGVSIGAFQRGPGKSIARRGYGHSLYATVGKKTPSSGESVMVCKVVCVGGYRNDNSSGGGSGVTFGIGTPGVFVGLNQKLK